MTLSLCDLPEAIYRKRRAVVCAGDVNGDGVADVVLSGSTSETGTSIGVTYVVFGRCPAQ